ncbi:hypothetical protein ABZP36_014574 [Zizania latifolia]
MAARVRVLRSSPPRGAPQGAAPLPHGFCRGTRPPRLRFLPLHLAARRGGLRHSFRPSVRAVSQVRGVPDPILRARNKRINTFDDNLLRRLAAEMFDVMYK